MTAVIDRARLGRRLQWQRKPHDFVYVATGDWERQWTMLTQCYIPRHLEDLTKQMAQRFPSGGMIDTKPRAGESMRYK